MDKSNLKIIDLNFDNKLTASTKKTVEVVCKVFISFKNLLSLMTPKSISILIALFLPLSLLAQTNFVCAYTVGNVNEAEICDMLGFKSKPEAQKAVENIVRRSGLKQNFYVMECPNIQNCYAATRNGERLIVYDATFMRKVNSMARTDWGAMSVLAHEIGHHLQGHTLKNQGSDPLRELEADEFAGFVMYQMGASLQEAQSAIWSMTSDFDSGTHPPRSKRLAAIKTGYNNAAELYPHAQNTDEALVSSTNSSPEEEKVIANENRSHIRLENVVKTGCVEGNCSYGYGVAVNRNTFEKYAGNWKNGGEKVMELNILLMV